MECDEFETSLKCLPSVDPTIHYVLKKTKEDWGNSCKYTYGRVKESILNNYYSFQDLFGKFSHSKAIHFLVLSLYINAERVCQRLD